MKNLTELDPDSKAKANLNDNLAQAIVDANDNFIFKCDNSDDDEDTEIELVVQGREIVVKESTLARHSRYFSHIFGFLDRPSEENDSNDVVVLRHDLMTDNGQVQEALEEDEDEPLTMISYQTMRSIVDFFETGALKVVEHNVKHLLLASQLLMINSVERKCLDFIESGLTIQNCVRHFVLADANPAWWRIARRIMRYIQLRFEQVRKLTPLYQLTDEDQLRRILRDECLTVDKEDVVWETVKEWIEYDYENRTCFLPMLLEEVQWHLVKDEKTIIQAMSDPLLAGFDDCIDMLYERLQYHQLDYAGKVAYWEQRNLDRPNRWPKLLVCTSYAGKIIECFDFEESRWRALAAKPGAQFGAEICYLKGSLYSLGGVQSKKVDRFDLEKGKWVEGFPNMTQYRVAHGTVTTHDQIFVMGGSAKASADFGPGLDEMEVLTFDKTNEVKECWKMVSSMTIGRSYLASTMNSEHSKIYVVAGCLTENTSTAEVYDMKTGVWMPIPNTLTKRDSLGLTECDGSIYAVGGFNNLDNAYLKSVEIFDPLTGKWSPSKPMSMARRSPGVVAHKCKLYVVGGMGEREDLRSVEVYDTIKAEWIKFSSPAKDVCGWASSCLVEKPLRMMGDQGNVEQDPMFEKYESNASRTGTMKRKKSSVVGKPMNGSSASTNKLQRTFSTNN